MVGPFSKFYTVSTVFFHKYGGVSVSVINFMSHFSILIPIKATVKLDNGNTGYAQGIGIILCHSPMLKSLAIHITDRSCYQGSPITEHKIQLVTQLIHPFRHSALPFKRSSSNEILDSRSHNSNGGQTC